MELKYRQWVKQHGYDNKASATNQCSVAVRLMAREFPELTVQVGYANGIYHCCLRDNEMNIVDPTKIQFDSPMTIEYTLIAERFLERDEIEISTGAIFLNN